MTVHAYTSFSFNYLARATVLARSLRAYHPDWMIWAFIVDHPPDGFDFDPASHGFDRLVYVEQLYGDVTEQWLFGHDVVEACTAIKGRACQMLLEQPDAEAVVYLDPDIAVFAPLAPVCDRIRTHSIVLTPHQTEPENADAKRAIHDNEITSLHFGSFNLGFLGLRNDEEANRFAQWWTDRLDRYCHDRLDIGLFVDQKWCNLVPCFFDSVAIIRDAGCNVASWNLSHRDITISKLGEILVNDVPLRFFHFTKLGAIGNMMTSRYAGRNFEVFELWSWYRNEVDRLTDRRIPKGYWGYGLFDNGTPIPKAARRLYRDREDLRTAFPLPRRTGDGSFLNWLNANSDIESIDNRADVS